MKLKLFFSAIVLTFAVNLAGQNLENLPRAFTSTGTECYVYTVQAKDGLYGIAKKFDVSQEDIIALNPRVKDGLKAGQPLYIPVKQDAPAKKDTPQTPPPTVSTSDEYVGLVNYQVEAKQTLYSIAKRFGVNQEDIIKYNPQAKTTVKEGEILRIPVRKQQNYENSSSNPALNYTPSKQEPNLTDIYGNPYSKYLTHTIQPKETLYSISKKYNVFVEDIVNANPDLESVLHVGETLRIPIKTDYAPPTFETLSIAKEVTTIRIAFLMPFSSGNLDMNNDRFLEFYSGALIAINKAKQNGASFEIYTYDTNRNLESVNAILNKTEMKNVDFIVGPAYTNQVGAVANFAKQNKIFTIVPFSSKVQGIAANPYLFQFNPSTETEIDFISTKLSSGDLQNANIIFIKPNNLDVGDEGYVWATSLENALTKKGKYSETTVWTTPADNTEIQTLLRSGVKNILIFMTDNYANVQPYVATINTLSAANINLSLYIRYSWLNYNFKNTETIYISPFNNTLNTSDLNVYQKDFSKYFAWKPTTTNPRYDLLGYDLTNCFINQLQTYGNVFAKDKKTIDYSAGVQSQFDFERTNTNSGFENQKIYFINVSGK
ncbi:MAG: penicillin-binding protein activator [Paludibacter sp.]|nr:penicillin-binding protein activator [Paludibacter sp.]